VIRKAKVADVKFIHQFLSEFSSRGEVLPRSLSEIYDNLRDHFVYCHEGEEAVVGACAIHVSWEDLAEIRSLVVKEEFRKRGIGRTLVESCIAEARELGIRRVFVLTYKTHFFENRGFHIIEKSILPHKIWADCLKCVKFPDCDEVAMMREI